MATPKLNRIIDEFGLRIGLPTSYSGTVLQDHDDMDADVYVAYINKALHKLFNEGWRKTQGDRRAFAQLFPELVKNYDGTSQITLTYPLALAGNSIGYWDVDAPCADLYRIMDVFNIDDVVKISVHPPEMFMNIAFKKLTQYEFSASNQIAVQIQNRVYVFGVSSADDLFLTYIRTPIKPDNTDGAGTAGDFLTQDGSHDSPFNDHWNSKIAEIAERLFRIDTQETT